MPAAFDFSNPPFDRLSERELERMKAVMDIAFFRQGETIIQPGELPESFFIIIKGVVQEVNSGEVLAIHGPSDCFDTSLLIERKCQHSFVVEEEAICYLLPIDELLDFTANNKAFAEFFYRDISLKLEALAARETVRALQSVMTARVRDAYIHPAVYIDAAESIFEAAKLMKAQKATSLLVRNGDRVGIVTGVDMREAVILERKPLETPVGSIATYDLVAVQADDFLFTGLLLMTRHVIKRVVVKNGDEIAGVLEQVDVLSFLSSQSYIITLQVERATSKEDLRQASRQLTMLVEVLHAHGTKITFITQLVAELSRKLLAKLYGLIAPPDLVANSCLIVMGSEGRGDQVLKSDQDNGLILRDGFESPDLEEVCQEFIDSLISFGYPSCPGNVMVSNPAWRKPLALWRDDIRDWVVKADDQALMNVAIFYDAAPVAGDSQLLADAKGYLLDLIGGNKALCARFARPIESFDVPLGIFSNIIVERGEHKDEIDLKKGAIFPIVHGARSLALEHRLTETNTVERIRKLEELGRFDHSFATELIEAYSFLLGVRLRARLLKLRMEQPLDNFIRPFDLNKFERDLLKDSLLVVNRFKELVRYHFNLRMF